MEMDRSELLRKLVDVQYSRNDIDFQRGTFRVRGDVVEIFPASREEMCIRVEFLAMKLIEFEVNYLTEKSFANVNISRFSRRLTS